MRPADRRSRVSPSRPPSRQRGMPAARPAIRHCCRRECDAGTRLPSCRLSNRGPACHMRQMRQTTTGPAGSLGLPHAQRSALATIRSMLPYLWPAGDPGARVRVVIALGLLLLAKLATVYVPVVYGQLVDALAPKDQTALLAIPLGL